MKKILLIITTILTCLLYGSTALSSYLILVISISPEGGNSIPFPIFFWWLSSGVGSAYFHCLLKNGGLND